MNNQYFYLGTFFLVFFLMFSKPSHSLETSGKLLLTGGVSQVEGAAGGGLSPWALVGTYATRDQFGANAFKTELIVQDFRISSFGAMIGIKDRIEISVAKQSLDTQATGAVLGLRKNFKFKQLVIGAKARVYGNTVLEQDTWLPQIAVGGFYKKSLEDDLVKQFGAKDSNGMEFYLAATKIILAYNLLANFTLRFSEANQLGIFGHGGDKDEGLEPLPELSLAYLITRQFALGIEYRTKSDNLNVAKEDDFYDAFLAWAPTKNISLTTAYAYLGDILNNANQRGLYTSLQIGF